MTTETITHKTCSRCQQSKAVEEFSKSALHGYQSACKVCARVLVRDWVKANPDRVKATRKAWAKANRAKLREVQRAYRRKKKEARTA